MSQAVRRLEWTRKKKTLRASEQARPDVRRKRAQFAEDVSDVAPLTALAAIMADTTAGDPISGLRWTHRSSRRIAGALRRQGYKVGATTVRRLLRQDRYALRVNRKRLVSRQAPERDVQFRYLAQMRRLFLRHGWPVISVDAKKRELVGPFKNAGRAWRRTPRDVNMYDFPSDAVGVAIPYGIYDVGREQGFLVVGTSHNTAAFAVAAIASWWRAVGRRGYPDVTKLLIEADSGSSNGKGSRLWKVELQAFADATGLTITVTHYPSGASKWNPVEHRLFSRVSANWAGHPLDSYETILKHLKTTRSETGLRCKARLDTRDYPTGIRVAQDALAALRLHRHR